MTRPPDPILIEIGVRELITNLDWSVVVAIPTPPHELSICELLDYEVRARFSGVSQRTANSQRHTTSHIRSGQVIVATAHRSPSPTQLADAEPSRVFPTLRQDELF